MVAIPSQTLNAWTKRSLSHFLFPLCWLFLGVASFRFSHVHCSFLFCFLSLLFLALKGFLKNSPLFPSHFFSLLPSFLYFFPSFPHCYLAFPSSYFMFRCFVLLLLVPSLALHFALAYSFTFWPIVTYSIYPASPCYCLLYPSYLALLLPTLSLTFYFACSLLHTSPYYCLLLPSRFALPLHVPSIALCLATYLFPLISFCYVNLRYCCYSLPLVLLFTPSCFTLLLVWCELVLPCSSMFCKLRNLEQTWSFKLFHLDKFSFCLVLFFSSLSF